MDSDNDFTFCQVGLPVDKNGLEAENLASDIGGIIIKDGFSNGTNSSQGGGVVWRDSLPNDSDSKNERTVGSLSFNVIDASDIGGMIIKDGFSNGTNSNQGGGVVWRDGLPNDSDSKNKRTDGSLSFNVIDASARGQSSAVPRQVASGNAGTSAKNFDEKKVSARKPVTRTKVPFEKGYSQMDWLKLTRTHPDLAGLKGQSNKRLISMDEVKQHQTEGSMWTVLKGRVYNLSPYLKFHPGGVDILMKAVGKDCTSLFNKYHAWVNAEFLLEKCLVGTLDVGQ